MTRGYRPSAAIDEAKRRAAFRGFVVIGLVSEIDLPFDFAIHDDGITSLVRVRRLKCNAYGTGSIEVSCAQQIRELRKAPIPEGIVRELWVRGPERAWHRYQVIPDRIVVLEGPDQR